MLFNKSDQLASTLQAFPKPLFLEAYTEYIDTSLGLVFGVVESPLPIHEIPDIAEINLLFALPWLGLTDFI
jgi:hypothetical protein